MADLKVIPPVTEVVTVTEGKVTLELTMEEAEGLGIALRGGVQFRTLSKLGITGVMEELRGAGLGNQSSVWGATADLLYLQ